MRQELRFITIVIHHTLSTAWGAGVLQPSQRFTSWTSAQGVWVVHHLRQVYKPGSLCRHAYAVQRSWIFFSLRKKKKHSTCLVAESGRTSLIRRPFMAVHYHQDALYVFHLHYHCCSLLIPCLATSSLCHAPCSLCSQQYLFWMHACADGLMVGR